MRFGAFGISLIAARVTLAASLLAPSLDARAQTTDCDHLRAQIASIPTGPSRQGARFVAAAQKQEGELARTVAYARSMGCENQQFLFFGNPPPPQCGGLNARIAQMRANLGALQAQARIGDGAAIRQALQARYDAACGRPRGLFDSLFGGEPPRQQVPIQDAPLRPSTEPGERPARGGSMAVCVRTCDGGYFPMIYRARSSNTEFLGELCKAQCPGTETAVYTMPPGGDIDRALSTDGDSYSDLPNAGKFRKAYNPTCACKPADKSWVDALKDAEEMLGRSARTDVIVTQEKSDELARPVAARAAAPGTPGAPPASDANPTPTLDNTGTTPGEIAPAPKFGLKDGETRDRGENGGPRRRVRVIGPKLSHDQ